MKPSHTQAIFLICFWKNNLCLILLFVVFHVHINKIGKHLISLYEEPVKLHGK